VKQLLVALAVLAVATPGSWAKQVPVEEGEPPPEPREPCTFVPVDFAVYDKISINGLYSRCGRNVLSVALGANGTGELRGLSIGVGVSTVAYDATGVQLGGLGAVSGESGTGIQAGGLFAASGVSYRGLQVGGLFAAAGRRFDGIQLGGLFAASGESFSGLQVGGLFSASGAQLSGVQLGGLFSASGDQMTGLQVGGLFAAGPRMRGIQIGGGVSAVAEGEGLQLSGGLSYAKESLVGVQIAVVNWGGDVTGAQIGVVNVARRVDGLQLGVVNVADDATAPIGLVSWMRRGERAAEVWLGEVLSASAGVRLGTRRVYSLLGIGAGAVVDGNPWGPLGGVGVMGRSGSVRFMLDALAHQLYFDGVDHEALLAQARARVGLPLAAPFEATLGVTWNVFVSDEVEGTDLAPSFEITSHTGATSVRQWPSLTLGASVSW
jgi:hypothetical protein